MKVVTATEVLIDKVRRQRRSNLLDLVRIIHLENPYFPAEEDEASEDDWWEIDDEGDLVIDAYKSYSLTINDMDMTDWLEKNAEGNFHSDKYITIHKII
jgi:hypothetical protein